MNPTSTVGLTIRSDASVTAALVAAAASATADAAEARRQARTLSQLLAFSQALGAALDRDSLRQVVQKHLPALVGERHFSVVLREDDVWDVLVQQGATSDADVCFPIVAGTHVAGMLNVNAAPPITGDAQGAISSAAAMIGNACKTMWVLAEARELSVRDALTGCFTKAHGLETIGLELSRARRTGSPLSILIFDIDNFKGINDQHGHLWGDEVLRAVGTQMGRVLRRTDVRIRYGGDEFIVILPDTPALGAQQVAEALRKDIASLEIQTDDGIVTPTLSIGVAAAMPKELNATTLLARADQALYQAKRNGRNRVAVAVPASAADRVSAMAG